MSPPLPNIFLVIYVEIKKVIKAVLINYAIPEFDATLIL